MILLLLACRPPSDTKQPGDTATPDTVADSADTSVGDSAPDDTGDTHDSGGPPDTGDTGETGVLPADWSPGEEIPGWEDYDCTETAGSQAFTTRFPDVFEFTADFLAKDATPVEGPHRLRLRLRDCMNFPCAEGDADVDRSLPYVDVSLDGTLGEAPTPRGIGWWGPDTSAPRAVDGSGSGPLESWSNGSWGSPGVVTVCMERVRPDEVRGAVRVEIQATDSTRTLNTAIFPSIVYRFPFSIPFDDHAGTTSSLPDSGDRPEHFATAHFVYDRPYAEAWPWDDIEDPGIRAAVYERYTPYNGE